MLNQQGVSPDSIVAICFKRGIPQILAILGIPKAGGAFLSIHPGAKREFWRGALEADTVEEEIVCLGGLLVAEQSGPIVHRRFFCEDFRVLYEVVPLGGVQLL